MRSGEARLVRKLKGDIRRIAEVAGIEAALKIARHFKGTYVYISGMDGFHRELRDEKIRFEYLMGESVRDLAARHSITTRHVRNIVTDNDPLSPELIGAIEDALGEGGVPACAEPGRDGEYGERRRKTQDE